MDQLSSNLCFGILLIMQIFDISFSQGSHAKDYEHLLLRDLFRDYNKDSRPVFDKEEAVNVELDVAYSQLVDLDGKQQILSSKVWIRQIWKNPFLSWEPSKYNGIKVINVNPLLVWKPDLVLYNNIGIGQTGAIYNLDTKVVIDHKGTNSWYAPTEIKSICKIDISFFPFDKQKCPLRFGSWTYTGSQLNLTNKASTSDLTKYTVSGEWELIAVPAARNVVKYTCCPDPYIDVTYTVHVRRKVLFYLTNLIMPCIVLAVLTVFSFTLPPESGERISLVITILLGLTVFMLVFTENVPRTSEVIPLIVKYSFTVMCEISFSLLITCFVVRVYHNNPAKPMPLWYRYLTHKILAPILLMKRTPAPERTERDVFKQWLEKTKTPKYAQCPSYVYASKLFSSLTKQKTCKVDETPTAEELIDGISGISKHSDNLKCPSLEKLEEISNGIHAINEHLKDIKFNECNRSDWHFAARVLDAFFFWSFALAITVSTVAFYFVIPKGN